MANNKAKRNTAKKGWVSTLILACMPVILIVASYLMYNIAMNNGLISAFDSFKDSREKAKNEIYQEIYEKVFELAEQGHHVSNRGSISLGTLKNTANLEVFRVPDTEYVIENREDNKYGLTLWLEVKGTGIFTVNLNLSEFLIDNARDIVTVRIPRLELEYDLNASEDNMKTLYKQIDFHITPFTNETKAAKEITDRMIEEGRQMIRDEISNTPEYYFAAQEATQEVLTSVLKSLNPDKEDLKVIVEFVE